MFAVENDTRHPVNISGGPLSYRYQFHEIHLHFGADDRIGSEHTVDGHAFPAEVRGNDGDNLNKILKDYRHSLRSFQFQLQSLFVEIRNLIHIIYILIDALSKGIVLFYGKDKRKFFNLKSLNKFKVFCSHSFRYSASTRSCTTTSQTPCTGRKELWRYRFFCRYMSNLSRRYLSHQIKIGISDTS